MLFIKCLLFSFAFAQNGSPLTPSVYTVRQENIMAMAVDGDNLYIGTGNQIKQLDALTGNEKRIVFNGHTDIINTIVIRNGFLFSGSADNSIRQWEISSQRLIKTYNGHTSEVLQILLEGNTMFSCGGDESIRIWYVSWPLIISNDGAS